MAKRTKLEIIFGIYVLIFSLFGIGNLFTGIQNFNYPALLVSLIGITACAFLYFRNKYALMLLNMWAAAQLISVLVDKTPVWDVSQGVSLDLYFNFELISGTKLYLGFNPWAILLIYCVWKLKQQVLLKLRAPLS